MTTAAPVPAGDAAIVLVCTANLVRSPLAAAMLRRRLDEHAGSPRLVIRTAGVRVQPGLPAASEAQEIARRMGLDLSAHRSRAVQPDMLADAHLVLTMTEAQRTTVLRQLGATPSRSFTLVEFVRLSNHSDVVNGLAETIEAVHRARPRTGLPDGPEDISDPIGRPMREFQRVAKRLDQLTTALVVALSRAA